MKTRIFTLVFNRPDLLQQQIDSFKKNLKSEYQFNVVYDTRDNEYLKDFTKICDKNEVNFYHHVSQPGKTASFYGSDTFRWTYENIILNDPEESIILVLDHDMFLIDEFDVNEFMNGYDIATPTQTREHIKYPWQGLFFFRRSILAPKKWNFHPVIIDGISCDAGGGLHSLYEDDSINPRHIAVEYPDEYEGINLKEYDDGFGFELFENATFLHARNSCHWHNGYDITNKENKKSLLNFILKNING